MSNRKLWIRSAVGLLVLCTAATAAYLVFGGRSEPPTRARVYTDRSACLLTGPLGLADPVGRIAWAGMQEASETTRGKVSYLAVAGPETVGNALIFAETLARRNCGTLVAVGAPQVDAATQISERFPATHVVIIGAASPKQGVTVIAESAPEALRRAVSTAVEKRLASD